MSGLLICLIVDQATYILKISLLYFEKGGIGQWRSSFWREEKVGACGR
jgi:hypothetical protein